MHNIKRVRRKLDETSSVMWKYEASGISFIDLGELIVRLRVPLVKECAPRLPVWCEACCTLKRSMMNKLTSFLVFFLRELP